MKASFIFGFMLEELYQKYLESDGVTTDSRSVRQNQIFFALKGGNFDGNEYAEMALEKGACWAVVDDSGKMNADERLIIVPNALETMQQLARHHRRQFKIPIIAITGTNGKTTTKELVSSVLGASYIIHYTKGNLNNHIGVPLTLLSMNTETEVGIIEMGANHPNEIDFLCRIAEPTHGLVTNVGKAHLEGFGGFEGVIRTKGELFTYLAETDGVAFINANEPHLGKMSEACTRRLKYGLDGSLVNKGSSPFLQIEWNRKGETLEIPTRLIGGYNFNNVLTAITLGEYFKVDKTRIRKALIEYTPKNNRSQLTRIRSNKIILDAYNANPTSMALALDNFNNINHQGKKIAILGDMLELGEVSRIEHQKIYDFAKTLELEQLLTIGNEFGKLGRGNHYSSIEALMAQWDWNKHENTLFLIKGSRGMKLEKLISTKE